MLARRGENVHTDPSLLDVAGALGVLPELVLDEDVRLKAHSCASTS
jgi:hypothetical protein